MVAHTEIHKLGTKIVPEESAEDLLIKKLALDIKTWGLTPEQGHAYFELHLKRTVSHSTYYDYLKMIDSDETLKVWIENQARVGFVKNHRDMMEEVLRLKDKVATLLQEELSKDDTIEIETKFGPATIANPGKSKQYIIGLMRQLTDLNKRLGELNLGNPVVATIKYMIEHNNQPLEKRNTPLKAII